MKASFFLYAMDETHAWSDLPDAINKVYGIYLVCNGEATHLCEVTPSSRADFMENAFTGVIYDEAPQEVQEYIENHLYENGGEHTTYFRLIAHDPEDPRCSELREFETDEEDEEEARDDLWEQARENFSANSSDPPIVWEDAR